MPRPVAALDPGTRAEAKSLQQRSQLCAYRFGQIVRFPLGRQINPPVQIGIGNMRGYLGGKYLVAKNVDAYVSAFLDFS